MRERLQLLDRGSVHIEFMGRVRNESIEVRGGGSLLATQQGTHAQPIRPGGYTPAVKLPAVSMVFESLHFLNL